MKKCELKTLALAAAATAVLAGCIPPDDEPFATVSARKVTPYKPSAPAGLPVSVSADPNSLKALIARAGRFGKSSDPFRLLPNEIQFERSQTVERLMAEQGNFNLEYEAPQPPTGTGPVAEPQPYRRLSGIVIGDAIVGILETQGQPTIIIRPGQYIPGTEWRVVLINEDRAVLRRAGNRLPREVTVLLELPPPGFDSGNGGGGPSGGPDGPGGRGPGGGRDSGPGGSASDSGGR
jgi:hypothetical protein